MALGAPRLGRERATVAQADRHAGPGILVDALRQSGVDDHVDAAHQLAHLRVRDLAVRERAKVDATLGEGGRGAELHRELALERGSRVPVREHVGYYSGHPDLDSGDVAGAQTVRGAKVDERVDCRVGEGARGIRLDGNARAEQLPGASQAVERAVDRVRAPERRRVTLTSLERGLRRGEPLARELRREDAAARRVSGMVGLGHRAEVFLERSEERRVGKGWKCWSLAAVERKTT